MLNFSISIPLDKTIDDDVSVKSDGESGVASTSTVSTVCDYASLQSTRI